MGKKQSIAFKKKIDAITIQVLKKESLSKAHQNYYLSDKKIINFIKLAKRKFKLVGVVTDDLDRLDILKPIRLFSKSFSIL